MAEPTRPSAPSVDSAGLADQLARLALYLVVVSGVAIRLYHLLEPQSLWADEAKLALNIVSHSLTRLLFAPLEPLQIAPPGFLALEKLFSEVLGPSEVALRLFPFICGVGSLFLVLRLFRELRVNAWATLLAMTLFALSPYLVLYSASVKQYSTDVAAVLIVLLLTVRFCALPNIRRAVELGVTGGLIAWFSHGVFFMYSGVGAALVWLVLRRKAPRRPVFLAMGLIGLGAVPAALLALAVTGADRASVQSYWSAGYLPFPPQSSEELLEYGRAFLQLLKHPFGLRIFPEVGALVFLLGVVALARRDVVNSLLVVTPLVAVFGAAALSFYPIVGDGVVVPGRLVLWSVPVLILGLAGGVSTLVGHRFVAIRGLGWAVMAILVFDTAIRLPGFLGMFRQLDVSEAAEALASHLAPGDVVYTSGLIWSPLQYYRRRLGFESDVVPLERMKGSPSPGRIWLVRYAFEDTPDEYAPEALGRPIAHFSTRGVRGYLIQVEGTEHR